MRATSLTSGVTLNDRKELLAEHKSYFNNRRKNIWN